VVTKSTVTAAGGERAALVEAVVPFLDEWQVLLKDVRLLTPERVGGLRDRAERLRHQADLAGQGAVVHHLEVCVQLLEAPGLDRRGFQEALRNLSEVAWQLKQEVGGAPRRGSNMPEDAGPRSMARPPLLSELGASSPAVSRALSPAPAPARAPSAPAGGVQPPPPISLFGAALPVGALGGSAPVAAARPPAAGPPAARPQRPFEPAGPSIIPAAGARAPAPAAPFAASPPILSGRPAAAAPAAPQKGKDKPNLMVATMFGLRAFGRGKEAPPAAGRPSAAPGPAPAGQAPQGGVLGLGQRARRESSGAPAWLGPREGGLPELATRGPAPPPVDSIAGDLNQRLRELRGSDGPRERRPSRPSRSTGAERVRSSSMSSGSSSSDLGESSRGGRRRDRPQDAGLHFPWWIGGVAVALVGLIVVAVLVFGRSSRQAPALQQPATQQPGVDTELPTSRLLDDKERMRALISLVHSYGGEESPELADLLNEEAALVYEVMERSCQQPGDKCERPVPMIAGTVRSGATPQHEIHHLFEDRKVEASGRARGGQVPKWLAGLSTPAIGTEDDPNVRRWVEYYTSNQVGREDFQNMLFRCGAYQDLIEKTLVHYGMPRALLALVMTESGCVPGAESPVGARGLWQFMPATARAYHLSVKEGVIDERISPPKSTEAAVKFLADLYRKMGSWEFALASYNMGPFGLSARIRRAGGDVTFWDLAAAGSLPEETAKYVPRIQAYALILENLGRFNFSTAQMRATEVTAELEAPPGTRLGMVARAASTSLDHLRLLNPDIVGTSVPDLPGSRFMVQVPKEDVFRARTLLEQLVAAGDQYDRCVPSTFDWGSERFTEKMCDGRKTKSPR
jgi:Transglycosylase SLT domain